MPPIIRLVRHAQGFHNLSEENHALRDPPLTPHGEKQCQTLAQNFPYHASLELLVTSPLKRTVYTALVAFADTLAQRPGLKIICLPELQETSDLPCDTGSSPEALAGEFHGRPVDLSRVEHDWDNKQGRWRPDVQAFEARAKDARKWLVQRPEKEILVVSHGSFLHYLTEDWTDSTKYTGTGWANTEFRSYSFTTTDPEDPHLTETDESRRVRRELEEKSGAVHNAAG